MSFCKDFIWGAATASYQIEGAAYEDGKGLSVWDRYSHEPGRIQEGDNGDVACDHYHRMKEDVALMRELGLKSYRFSLSWPRLLPKGTGEVNEQGVAFYNALIDELLANGIRPFITLFHWDYPSALQQKGAWENPESPKWFEEYAMLCAQRFGDRVKDFITMNEPQIFIGLGYVKGEHAPGLALPLTSTIPIAHNVLKAHGLAVKALRKYAPGCRVGYAPCGDPRIPASRDEKDIAAARKSYMGVSGDSAAWAFSVAWWSDPVVLGHYPQDGLKYFEKYLPEGWEKDMELISQPLDFYAQNIYSGKVVRAADNAKGYEYVPHPVGHTKTGMRWPITPDALYWGPYFLYERYKLPFIITENGISITDLVSMDGKVHDPQRQDYIHRYLQAYKRAAEDGVDIRGYFAWSLMDNFEWSHGYTQRFGLVYVDFETQQRIVKDSAWWYKKVIESNGENL